jgi:hypothetical protein
MPVVAFVISLLLTSIAYSQTYTPTMLGSTFVPYAVNSAGAVCGQLNGFPSWWFPGWAAPQYLPGATSDTPGVCTSIDDNGDTAGTITLATGQNLGWICRAPCASIQAAKMPQWSSSGQHGVEALANDRSWAGWAIGVDNACWLWAPKPIGNYYVYPKCLRNTGVAGPVPLSFMTRDGTKVIGAYDMGTSELGFNLAYTVGATSPVEIPRGNIHGMNSAGWAVGEGGSVESPLLQLWFPDGNSRLVQGGCSARGATRVTSRDSALRASLPTEVPEKVRRVVASFADDTFIGMSGLGINHVVSAVGFTQCMNTIHSWRWDHWSGIFWDVNALSGANLLVPVDIGFGGHIIALCLTGNGVEGCLLTPGAMARTAATE